jgi:hypothetical protein
MFPRDMVCLRNISVYTLHKGDTEDTVIIGATGTVSKAFRKYVSNMPGNHEVKELQKTAILATAHLLRKVLT